MIIYPARIVYRVYAEDFFVETYIPRALVYSTFDFRFQVERLWGTLSDWQLE